MARVADLNGNGLPDVVAGARGALGLTFLNGTGGPYQIPARLGSHSALSLLTTGDFDGDLIGDTAFIEDDPVSPGVGVLAVAFGQRDGIPLPATRIAQMRGVTQLASYREMGLDAMMAASHDAGRGQQRGVLTLFDGNPDRLPFAPYTLVPFAAEGKLQDQVALGLAAGSFTARKSNDVVALGSFGRLNTWDLWLLPNAGDERQPPQRLVFESPADVFPVGGGDPEELHVSLAPGAADLDADGHDESLWLMPAHAPSSPEGVGEVVGCALLAYDLDAQAAHQRFRLDFPEHCSKPELLMQDLDGDQAVDLLLLLDEPSSGRRIRILWNDGQGGFSTDASSDINGPVSESSAEPLDLRALTVLPGAPPRRLAFVDASSLYVASAGSPRSYDHFLEVPGFTQAQAVTSLDVNADGVDELVVADAQGIWLLARRLK
jgi:hypothetical protein